MPALRSERAPRSGGARRGAFRQELGWFSLLSMSLGTVIGSGWLILPAAVAAKAGPASVVSWIFGGLVVLVVALVYAELGAAWPAAGAVALYPRLSHGAFTGHLAGWAAFISYAIIPPAEAVAVTRYAGTFIPSLVTPHQDLSGVGLAIATSILAAIGLLNYAGVRYLGIFQNWVTSLKYVPIVLFVVGAGLFAFHRGNFTAFGGFAPTGASGIMLGTAGTVFAYLGFRQALDFGAEARRPGRDLPLAIILTVLIAIATYALIAIVFVGAIDWAALARHGGVAAGDWASLARLPAPIYDVAVAAGLGIIAWLVFADGILSPNGPNATNCGSVPRVAYTMAESGTMPRLFLHLDPRFGTPGWGLLACFLLETLFCSCRPAAIRRSSRRSTSLSWWAMPSVRYRLECCGGPRASSPGHSVCPLRSSGRRSLSCSPRSCSIGANGRRPARRSACCLSARSSISSICGQAE